MSEAADIATIVVTTAIEAYRERVEALGAREEILANEPTVAEVLERARPRVEAMRAGAKRGNRRQRRAEAAKRRRA